MKFECLEPPLGLAPRPTLGSVQAKPESSGLLEALTRAQKQYGVFSRRQAAELGVGYHALYRAVRASRIQRDLPGVYRLPGAERSWKSELMAAQLWLDKPDGCVSHGAAAALWSLPGFKPGPIELSSTQWKNPLPPIVVHKLSIGLVGHTTTVGPISLTNAGRTLVDVAGMVPTAILERAVEDAIRRGLTSRPHLRWLLQGRAGKNAKGIARLRELISTDAPVTESEFEARLFQAIRRERLPVPVRQHEIVVDGEVIARVDFAYPWAKVAIEADSYQFHSGRERWESDLDRRSRLTALGWFVIHVTYRQMTQDMGEVARRIREVISPRLTE